MYVSFTQLRWKYKLFTDIVLKDDGTPLTSPASVIMAVTSPFSPKTTLKRSEVRVEYTKVQQQSVSARECKWTSCALVFVY